jgi:hypothetical protein
VVRSAGSHRLCLSKTHTQLLGPDRHAEDLHPLHHSAQGAPCPTRNRNTSRGAGSLAESESCPCKQSPPPLLGSGTLQGLAHALFRAKSRASPTRKRKRQSQKDFHAQNASSVSTMCNYRERCDLSPRPLLGDLLPCRDLFAGTPCSMRKCLIPICRTRSTHTTGTSLLEGHSFLHHPLSSGMEPPSTTATAPAFPASTDPFRRDMQEITSVGSRRCQLASVCFELAPTVTENTWSRGNFDCRSERNISTTC